MTNNFDVSINRLLDNEKGYSNDPLDPGGETNFGLSKRTYPDLDIKNITRDQAIAIYFRDFWMPIGGDSFPLGVGYQLLDFAVNSGIPTAIRALQRTAGVVDDGKFGSISLAALRAQSVTDTIMKFLSQRLIYMTGLNNWDHDGKGWARRIAADLQYGAQDT